MTRYTMTKEIPDGFRLLCGSERLKEGDMYLNTFSGVYEKVQDNSINLGAIAADFGKVIRPIG